MKPFSVRTALASQFGRLTKFSPILKSCESVTDCEAVCRNYLQIAQRKDEATRHRWTAVVPLVASHARQVVLVEHGRVVVGDHIENNEVVVFISVDVVEVIEWIGLVFQFVVKAGGLLNDMEVGWRVAVPLETLLERLAFHRACGQLEAVHQQRLLQEDDVVLGDCKAVGVAETR